MNLVRFCCDFLKKILLRIFRTFSTLFRFRIFVFFSDFFKFYIFFTYPKEREREKKTKQMISTDNIPVHSYSSFGSWQELHRINLAPYQTSFRPERVEQEKTKLPKLSQTAHSSSVLNSLYVL